MFLLQMKAKLLEWIVNFLSKKFGIVNTNNYTNLNVNCAHINHRISHKRAAYFLSSFFSHISERCPPFHCSIIFKHSKHYIHAFSSLMLQAELIPFHRWEICQVLVMLLLLRSCVLYPTCHATGRYNTCIWSYVDCHTWVLCMVWYLFWYLFCYLYSHAGADLQCVHFSVTKTRVS